MHPTSLHIFSFPYTSQGILSPAVRWGVPHHFRPHLDPRSPLAAPPSTASHPPGPVLMVASRKFIAEASPMLLMSLVFFASFRSIQFRLIPLLSIIVARISPLLVILIGASGVWSVFSIASASTLFFSIPSVVSTNPFIGVFVAQGGAPDISTRGLRNFRRQI